MTFTSVGLGVIAVLCAAIGADQLVLKGNYYSGLTFIFFGGGYGALIGVFK